MSASPPGRLLEDLTSFFRARATPGADALSEWVYLEVDPRTSLYAFVADAVEKEK